MSGVLHPKIPPHTGRVALEDDPAATAATRVDTDESVHNAPDTDADDEDRPVITWVRERRTRIQH